MLEKQFDDIWVGTNKIHANRPMCRRYENVMNTPRGTNMDVKAKWMTEVKIKKQGST